MFERSQDRAVPATSRPRARRRGQLATVLAAMTAATALAGDPPSPTASDIVGAVVRCAERVRWPAAVLPDHSSPIHVCVLGDDSVSTEVASRLSTRRAASRSLTVRRGLEIKRPCHILYVSSAQADRLLLVRSVLGDEPTLTVGDGARFPLRGGMVGIVTSDGTSSLALNRKEIERVNLVVAGDFADAPIAVASAPAASSAATPTVKTKTVTRHGNGAGTYDQRTVGQAAAKFFGITTANLAEVIQKAFDQHGEPNGYIEGGEVSGAFIVGVRYGKGVLHRKNAKDVELFWRGPSVGIDAGGNAAKVFVLVYNLDSTDQIYARFPGVDGSVYVVGGVGINYQENEDVVLAPIRTGLGLRLGANVGYLHYSKDQAWMPF